MKLPRLNLDKFSLFIFGSITIIVLISLYLVSAIFKIRLTLPSISLPRLTLPTQGVSVSPNPDALYFTQPIYSFSGAKVINKSKNAIWIEISVFPLNNFSILPAAGSANATTPTPIQYKKLTFKVAVNDKTSISTTPIYIPYSFKQTIAPPAGGPATAPAVTATQLNIGSLSVGDLVNVSFTTDLRILKGNTITATNIIKITPPNILSGQMTKTSANSIQITATPPSLPMAPLAPIALAVTPPPPKTYTITVTSDTEITTNGSTGQKKITFDNLSDKDNVTVYSNNPIENTSFPAAKIDMMIPLPLIPPITPPLPIAPPTQ